MPAPVFAGAFLFSKIQYGLLKKFEWRNVIATGFYYLNC